MKHKNFKNKYVGIIFLNLVLGATQVQAQVQTQASRLQDSASSAESELSRAFKREFSYLAVQNEVLDREEKKSEIEFAKQKRSVENQILDLEKKIAQISAHNEILKDEVQVFEKRKREVASKMKSFAGTYEKARKLLQETERSLNLDFEKDESEKSQTSQALAVATQNLKVTVSDYKALAQDGLNLLRESSQVSRVQSSYLNEKGDLVQGSLIRYGRIGAQALNQGVRSVLAPGADGFLQELKSARSVGTFVNLYVFENIKTPAVLKKAAGFWDKTADLIPLIVLAGLFLLVLALFSLFARE